MFLQNRNGSTLLELPEGVAGIKATLDLMREIVIEYRKNEMVRELTANLVKDLRSKDYAGEIRKVHEYVRDQIRYLRDVHEVETLHTPDEILFRKQGDCDDKSILVASMLQSIGHPVRFVAIGFAPGEYEHVYPETRIGNRWVSVETTEDVNVGWNPDNVQARMVVHI